MLKSTDYSEEELLKKREEAERKARRGEIDPVQEVFIQKILKLKLIKKLIVHLQSDIQDYRPPQTGNTKFHV